MSCYLGERDRECGSEAGKAYCDRCGGGLTELERGYAAAAEERLVTEETLQELVDGCTWCWAQWSEGGGMEWEHSMRRVRGGRVKHRRVTSRFVRFGLDSHSCFRCVVRQKLCRTGQEGICRDTAVARATTPAKDLGRSNEQRDGGFRCVLSLGRRAGTRYMSAGRWQRQEIERSVRQQGLWVGEEAAE